MGKVKWLTGFIIFCCSLTVHAHAQRQVPQQKTNSGQQANTQDKNNTTQQNPADTTGAANAGDADQNQSKQEAGNSGARPVNTPAVPETTTSQSGSPAVLSGKDGSQRDGTNNVQRASMNMAGSPANGLRLSEKRSVNAGSEIKDRQRYSRDKELSAQRQNQKSGGTTTASGNSSRESSGEINDNSRKENNDLSDQNKSSKKSSDKKSRRKTG